MRQDADAVQGDHQTYSDGGLNLIYKGFESNRRILEGRRLFLVCRGSFDRLEIAEYIKSLDPVRFSDFTPNPKMEEARKGVEMFRTSGCDTILAVGGGSPIDVAKCIKHYSGADVPIIAIPTTAGTGSESTANARVAAERGGTVICCTRYGNVMCSRGSVIPLFIDQIHAGNPITITDPNMTRFLMNLDEAVDLVKFAFEHAEPGDLFIQKADASTIGDLAKGVQQLFGDTGTKIIGTRHGEKLFETLMTREERLRSEDMGNYFRVSADNRDLNYDKYFVEGKVETQADESYTSHNTRLLDVEGVIQKILTTDYVQEELKGIRHF